MGFGVELTWSVSGVEDPGWRVATARLRERLDEPYELALTLDTDADRTEPEQLLGKRGQLLMIQGGVERIVTGVVCEVEARSERSLGRMPMQLVVRPALEALRYRVDCRIFQGKTVPEILEIVLAPLAEHDSGADLRLARSYRPNDYRVQYQESDYDFARRLMEEDGISYFFDFAGETERMVLVDGPDEWTTVPAAASGPIRYTQRDRQGVIDREGITSFVVASRVRPTKLSTRHFHWRTPSRFLEGEDDARSELTFRDGASIDPEREIYQHEHQRLTSEPDAATYGADQKDQLGIRREAQRRDARTARGTSSMLGVQAASTFELTEHPSFDLDGEYLIVGATHEITRGADYENTFECLPRSTPFRPARTTAKPRMPSIQTGIVVGPAGEEIHTDEHGRIKVQLPWDRQGALDEHASCWMRVRQPWAGAGWGFLFLPRIGMEVIVDFVNGDPDRPLVLGCVYDGEHLVPYPLPDEKTKSTIKTESSLGGGGFNELRFEDLAGSEEIFIHAQKDFNEVVENDHTTTVHHDQKIRVDNDQAQEVGSNQTEHVFANQDMTVDANRTVVVHGNFTETIDGSHTRLVSSGVTETIDAGETRTVTGGMTESITGDRSQTIDGGSTETITGSLTQTVTGGAKITTPGAFNLTALGGLTITAAGGTKIMTNTFTLVAPAGNTHHDQWWKFFARSWTDNFAWKVDVTPIAIEVAGVKISANSAFYCQSKGLAGGAWALRSKTWTMNGDSSAEVSEAKAIDAELKAAGLRA